MFLDFFKIKSDISIVVILLVSISIALQFNTLTLSGFSQGLGAFKSDSLARLGALVIAYLYLLVFATSNFQSIILAIPIYFIIHQVFSLFSLSKTKFKRD